MLLSFFVTVYFWVFLATVLGVVTLATIETVIGTRGEYRDFTLLKRWLPVILRRGYDGGYLRLGNEESKRFMQFRKYIRGQGDYGLELQCIAADWLESTWQQARALAERTGLSHRVEPLKTSTGAQDGLIVDCGQDTAAAYEIGRSIWTDVFGLSLITPFKAISGHRSIVDELIDRPDHPPPLETLLDSLPREEWLKEFDARQRRQGGPSWCRILLAIPLVLIVVITGIGFPIAMLLSRGQAPDWAIELGAFEFGGSTAGLVLFLVFILSFLCMRRIKMGKVKKPKKPWETHLVRLGRAVALLLPFTVILAWAGY